MESRLEAYRAKKRKALEEEQKHAKYWDLITLAPLRRRVFGEANIDQLDSDVSIDNYFIYCTIALFLTQNMFQKCLKIVTKNL